MFNMYVTLTMYNVVTHYSQFQADRIKRVPNMNIIYSFLFECYKVRDKLKNKWTPEALNTVEGERIALRLSSTNRVDVSLPRDSSAKVSDSEFVS